MTTFHPRPYQWLIIQHVLAHERCNVFASPGMGKTSATLEAFATLHALGESRRGLILAPKRVAVSTWPQEVRKWGDSFAHLPVAAAVGTPSQRLAALQLNTPLVAINYENIDWLLEVYKDNWPFDTVIPDEVSRLRGLRVSFQRRKKADGTLGEPFLVGQGASRARALAEIAHTKIRRWVGLTGSPAANGLEATWALQWFVDGGLRLGNSFTAFSQRWFRPAFNSTPEQQRLEPMPYARQQIERLMAETTITVSAEDWFDIKKPIERRVMIDLPRKARQQYDEMQEELFTYIDNHPLEVFAAGAKSQKLLQIANGAVWIDRNAGTWVQVHDEKIEALRSIVEETNGEPLLVAYTSVPDKHRILKAFPQATTLEKDSQRKEQMFRDGKIPMLVVHPQSAGHGLDLQHSCHILVDFSSGWDLEFDEQVIERIGPTRQAQLGKNVAVFRYRIVARDTLEQYAVLPRLQSKASVQEALKNAMKQLR